MSKADEDRARQRFADNMRNDAARVKAAAAASEARKKNGPHLIQSQGERRCSICKMPFHPDVKPSQAVAFAEHVLKAHQPGQTTEDVNQAAARIVRESTER